MVKPISRRLVVAGGAVGLALPSQGRAALPSLVAVEWGGSTGEAMQALQSRQSIAQIRWEQHAGGAAAILAKIQAALPKVNYDVVAAWSPVFVTMIAEDWLETVTVAEMPNLAQVPAALFMKDKTGALKTIPRDINPQLWGYRQDICPFAIAKMEDLLDPRLKGQVCFPGPVMNTSMQMISIARAFGGDEFQMDTAWDFVKKLARSGNIGRVATSDIEVFNSLSSGETSVGFSAASGFVRIARDMPLVMLAKMPAASGFKSAIAMEGWCILKGGNTQLAKDWVNAMMSAKANEEFCAQSDHAPTNIDAKPSPRLAPVTFTGPELAAYSYTPDWQHIAVSLRGWTERWEKEVTPLL
jgi:putative spermidine/putrescine transport system substrate-binding protein